MQFRPFDENIPANPTQTRDEGGEYMNTTGFFFTLGLGMAAGAMVTSMLPQNSDAKKVVDAAANTLEETAKKVANSVGS